MVRLNSDPVFSALTRPQMMGGVTYGYAVFNLIVTLELFLLTRSFWSFAVAGVLHVIGYDHPVDDARYASPMWRRQERLLRGAMVSA